MLLINQVSHKTLNQTSYANSAQYLRSDTKFMENFGVNNHQGPLEEPQDKKMHRPREGQMLMTFEKLLLYACFFWENIWMYM